MSRCALLLAGLGLAVAGCALPRLDPAAIPAVSAAGVPELTAAAGERRAAPPSSDSPYVGAAAQAAGPRPVPGEVVVGLAAGAAAPVDLGSLGIAVVKDRITLAHDYALLGLPAGTDLDAAIAALQKLPGVLSASPSYLAAPRSAPTDDLLLPAQWAFEPNVSDVYGSWSLLPSETASASVWSDTVVAVVDSGVDPNHPDLNVLPGFWSSKFTPSGQAVPTESFDPFLDGHGTGCAGILGAKKGGSNIGAAGVVPGVQILPIRVINEIGGASDFAIVRGLLLAGYYNRSDSPYPNVKGAGGKVRVVNLSYGPTAINRSRVFDEALEFLRQRGIVVSVAAGNFGVDGRVEIPANSPAAIGVSATMQHLGFEMLAPYSSHGPEIWVAGPGNFLWSTWIKEGAADYSKAYVLFNGTSSAAPFVAGIAAAINMRYGSGGPDQDTAAWADRVKRRLADTADDLGSPGFDDLYGYGRVNARRALEGSLP